MFGKNAVTSPFRYPDTLMINSIFPTIQGEGPDSGLPAVFVRLSKCNLRCFFCDTEFETGQGMTTTDVIDKILEAATNYSIGLVVITGGEPLLQNINPLVEECNKSGLRVSVETAGATFYKELRDKFPSDSNRIICSPKTPIVNRDLAELVSAWKYIIRDGEVSITDGLPIYSTQREGIPAVLYRPLFGSTTPIYVQPCDEGDPDLNEKNMKVAVDASMKFGYRLSVQAHKIAGVP